MILVSGQGIHIPTNTSLMAAISPIMKDILHYNHEHYEENTKMLLQDYSTETIEAFLELVHLENVCLTGPEIEDLRNLISDLGIDQDYFSVSRIEDTSEYLSRYLSNGESSAETFHDQEDSSLSKEVERSVMNYGKTNHIHPSFFSDQLKKRLNVHLTVVDSSTQHGGFSSNISSIHTCTMS